MPNAFGAASELASHINPSRAAINCGFKYETSQDKNQFLFNLFGRPAVLEFPDFKGYFSKEKKEIPPYVLAIVLYHLAQGDDAPLASKWISYADLPGGRSYVKAFKGYTSNLLQKHFKNDLKKITESAKALKLKRVDIDADAAYLIDVLPKVPIAFIYRLGDDEFEPVADFLFDANAALYLPSDCYAVTCAWLTGSIINKKWFI